MDVHTRIFKTHGIGGKGLGLLLLIALISLNASAQWRTQRLSLSPGWNAVFLEVQPEPRDTPSLFQDIPVQCVCFWNRSNKTVQYVQDPSELLPEQPDWLKYFPEGSEHASFTNLHAIQGGRPYLIKISGANPVEWVVKGQPVLRSPEWIKDSYNFVGCYLEATSSITFQDYFGQQAAHSSQAILRLDSAGHWTEVPASSTEVLQQGEAYWVYSSGSSDYAGLLSVKLEDNDGLAYGRSVDEATLVLRNARAQEITVSLTPTDSEAPPPEESTLLAGAAPLSHYVMDLANNAMGWQALDGPVSITVPAEGEKQVRIAVRRTAMTPVSDAPVEAVLLYQSLLEVRDPMGSLLRIPVSARGLDATAVVSAKHTKSGKAERAVAQAGLWHGYVAINAVSQPANQNPEVGPTTPLPTASEFKFPLIVHVDHEGRARLLQQVYVLWQDGTRRYEGEDEELSVLDEPGRYVLVTRDDLVDQFQGSSIRNGKEVGRRLSSAAFSHRSPLEMLGSFGTSLALTGSRAITLDHDDPLNPFKHRYHPDHKMDEERPTVRADGSSASWYSVSREIQLNFSAEDPELGNTAQWGDRIHGGVYKESLIGIHQQLIYVEGFFRLSKVVDVPLLNDGIE